MGETIFYYTMRHFTNEEIELIKLNILAQTPKKQILKLLKTDSRTFNRECQVSGIEYPNFRDKKRIVKHNPFKNVNNPDVQYWLGWLATDGYVSHSENRVTLSLSIKDIDVIEKFRDFISPNLTIHHSMHHQKFEMVFVSFRNKEITDFLFDLGFNTNKTFNFVPNFEITWDYIRGVFEGDGYIREKEINITGASKEHITLIYNFVKQSGINCSLKQKVTPLNTIMYDFEIHTKKDISQFVDKIYAYADIFMDRKYRKARTASNSCWKTLKFGEPALGIPSQASSEEGVTT